MHRTALALACALALSACDGDRPDQIDLLFVIDHSGSTAEEQSILAAAMPALLAPLEQRSGGLPSMNIGIVNADMGAGPTAVGSTCQPGGDRGALQVREGCGLDPASGNWFVRTGGGRQPNFTGTLPQTLGCLVRLGVSGCIYEHHLLSMQAALVPSSVNPQNVGFVRAGAVLAVVFLADEDDCSAEATATFYQETRPGEGPSLRCATLGHTCNGQPIPTEAGFTAPLSACAPYQRNTTELNTRLIGVPAFVDSIKALKRYQEQMLFVGAIVGWDDAPSAQYRIVERPSTSAAGMELDLGTACFSTVGSATPAIRLHAFASAFANRTIHGVCAEDLSAAMGEIGRKLSALLD